MIHFSRQCYPNFVAGNHLLKMLKQRLIHSPGIWVNQVVRVRYETHESVSFSNQVELFLPEVYRIIVQYLEKRIIFARGQRNLENLANKVWEDRTATSTLWLQLCNIRHRHVVEEFVCAIPIEIAVHNSRPKASRVELDRKSTRLN